MEQNPDVSEEMVEAAASALYNLDAPGETDGWIEMKAFAQFSNIAWPTVTAERYLGRARGALTAALASPQDNWRTMDSAPKDVRILVRNELWEETFGGVQIAEYQDGVWLFDGPMIIDDINDDAEDGITAADYQPTHWQPLPSPPHAGKESGR